MRCLILTEDLAGLRNQALGLAERAGLDPVCCSLHPRGWQRRLPPRLWTDPLAMVSRDLPEMLPRLVIGCGGVAAAVGAALARRGHGVVHVQNPRIDPARFDLVVVQDHDRISGPNILSTRTALHRVTPARLHEARAEWAPRLAHLPRPLVGVLIGGSNGRFRLDAAAATALGRQLAAMAAREQLGIALTPSRRTGADAIAALAGLIRPPCGWVWDGTGQNPYFGLLACADALIVTGDSVSMISEAAATDVPVMVAALPGRSRRIAEFTAGLVAAGRVRPYAGVCEAWLCERLDDTDAAAARLRALAASLSPTPLPTPN